MTSATKSGTHTPGPWRKQWTIENKRTRIGRWFFVSEAEGMPVVNLRGRYNFSKVPDQIEANARLIAAAPELLEALEVIYAAAESWHQDTGHEDDDPIIQCDAICACLPQMKAAIQKALGEQP